jgi:thiol-disulfide isomerase/thioredoxin
MLASDGWHPVATAPLQPQRHRLREVPRRHRVWRRDMNPKRLFLATAFAGGWAVATASRADSSAQASVPAGGPFAGPGKGPLNESTFMLEGATGWLNSKPLGGAELRGKVVLFEFWTYSCINWRREYAYVRAWAAKYADQGLVVIGVHSPEFTFEKDAANVRRAVGEIGVTHPVALDAEHRVWRAFGNAYWPALYFVGADGRLRHHHFGEGDYERSERVIQQLLTDSGAARVPRDLVVPNGAGAEAPPDWQSLRSGETYLGYGRQRGFASGGAVANQRRVYHLPSNLGLNRWALAGDWALMPEAAVLHRENGRIATSFHARDVHLVMGPSQRDAQVQFRVTIDGQAPGAAGGVDVDAHGMGGVDQHRMYSLIRQPQPIAARRFEIEFLSAGVEAYCLTFG